MSKLGNSSRYTSSRNAAYPLISRQPTLLCLKCRPNIYISYLLTLYTFQYSHLL